MIATTPASPSRGGSGRIAHHSGSDRRPDCSPITGLAGPTDWSAGEGGDYPVPGKAHEVSLSPLIPADPTASQASAYACHQGGRAVADLQQTLEADLDEAHFGLEAVSSAAHQLSTITLDGIAGAALLDRTDTKFILSVERVPELLHALRGDYRILEIDGQRLSEYETVYYDTDDFALYHAHHAGRPNRMKLRLRTYCSTGRRFMELKMTRNGRTVKERAEIDSVEPVIPDLLERADSHIRRPDADRVGPVLKVAYTRLTLVSRTATERVTIDVDLRFEPYSRSAGSIGDAQARYGRSAIIEVKQSRHAPSPAMLALRATGERPRSISKYCVGVATLMPSVKSNRFKPTLTRLRARERGKGA